MKHVHRAFRLIPALLGSALFVGAAAAHDVHAPVTGASGAGNAAANAASQAGAAAANSATQAARDDASGKIRISRSEARERAKKAYIANRGKNGITDAELSKRIKAAIHKKYEIEDDPAPPAPSDTVVSASVDPPVVSASVDPPETPKRKTFSPEELAAIVARHDAEKKRRQAALDDEKRKQAAAEAYTRSRVYDNALASWIDHHSQTLPNGRWGLASDWNAALKAQYFKEAGIDLERVWEEQERAKFTGQTPIWRATPVPPKEPFKPQSDRFSENDPRPQMPAYYVPPK